LSYTYIVEVVNYVTLCLKSHIVNLIMFDVKLTPIGRSVDHLPICMNG